MEASLAQLQADVVNAFLDEFEERSGWSKGFVHAEFALVEDVPQLLAEAFLVPDQPDPVRPDYVPLGWPVLRALEALCVGYAREGQAFAQLDLLVAAPDGRYRFTFSREPSLRLAGKPDAAAESYLADRYAELLREA